MKKFALLFAIIPVVLASSVFAAWQFAETNGELDSDDSEELSVDYNFDNIYDVTYNGFADTPSLPAHAMENREFQATGLNYHYIKSVVMNGETLEKGSGYNMSNGTLSIPSVDGPIAVNALTLPSNGLIATTSYYDRTADKFGDFYAFNKNSGENGADYSDNNGDLTYSGARGLQCDENNPIASLTASNVPSIYSAFSASITVKAKPNQESIDGQYPRTIIGIRDPHATGYLFWMGLYKNYLHVYAFRNLTSNEGEANPGTELGFTAIDYRPFTKDGVKEAIVVNIIITARKRASSSETDNVNLWITAGQKDANGSWPTKTFKFTSNNRTFTWENCHIVVGDLDVNRNLKLIGTIYDVHLYNREFTHDEVVAHREYAATVWPLGT